MSTEQMRINKYLSNSGFCSRREADRLLEAGRVTIDGRRAGLGDQVSPGQDIRVDDISVHQSEEKVLIALHKPAGIVCTSSPKDKNNIIDFLHFDQRIYPVGRLDKDSTGLILLTNNGEITDRILRGRNGHEKEYEVQVHKPIKPEIVRAMEQGVPILGTMTKPCHIVMTGKCTFRMVLTQGLNRQIRRMCDYFGYRVTSLKRIRIMNIELGDLPEGKWRHVTPDEQMQLEQALKGQKFYNKKSENEG